MKNIFVKKAGLEKHARQGSALLITILMLGVMMTLTLGVSTLVIREIRVTQSIVDANKAYYAAEAGVEKAMLGLSKHKAGYEAKGDWTSSQSAADDFLKQYNPNYSYSFAIGNKTDSVPSFPDDQPIFADKVSLSLADGSLASDCQLSSNSNPTALAYSKDDLYRYCPRATYRKLGLNETAIIPLFSDDGSGSTVSVDDFLVEYYLNIRDGSDLYPPFNGMKLQNFDVLRWKIYGQPKVDDGVQRTESIADFYPGVDNNSPERPVCIGTDASVRAVKEGSGISAETCIFPSLSKRAPTAEDLATSGSDLNDVTLWSAARECYQTDAGAAVTGGAQIKGTTIGDFTGCSMRDFIDNHKENYLILTNMVNPNVAGIANINDPSQLARADIYYRVIAKKDAVSGGGGSTPKLVKDFAEIHSQGFAALNGAVAKTLDVRYKAPGFLPVFNFSLYKTKDQSKP